MRRCPKCGREYTDETLRYCLEDGAALVAKVTATSQAPTMVHSSGWAPPPAPAAPARASNAGRIFATLAILLGLLSFLLVFVGLVASAMKVRDEAVGGIVMFSLPCACLGFLLGLIALYRAYRARDGMGARKTAIFSVILNLLYLVVLASLLILGLTMMS